MSERIVTPEWIAIERSWCAIGVATPASMLHALDEVERLQATVERVRALHTPPPNTFESVWFGNDGQVLLLVCNECGENLPCPTLRALEETP